MHQSALVTRLLGGTSSPTTGTSDSINTAANPCSRRTNATASGSNNISSHCSSRRSSCDADGDSSAAPAAAPLQRRASLLSKQLRKQLGLGSVSAGDAWSAVAGAAGAAEPISQLQRLQRRLSQYTTQKQAYSDAHAGTMLVLYVDSRWEGLFLLHDSCCRRAYAAHVVCGSFVSLCSNRLHAV